MPDGNPQWISTTTSSSTPSCFIQQIAELRDSLVFSGPSVTFAAVISVVTYASPRKHCVTTQLITED